MVHEIRTERLQLRPLVASDAEAVCSQVSDWEVMRWLSQPPWPYTLQDAIDFIQSCAQRDLIGTTFAITREGALIGVIDVRMESADRTQRGPGPNLGYWLARHSWGNGYMTEAARGLLAHVFAAGIGDTVYSGAFADNEASLRVQERVGFVRAGDTMLFARPHGAALAHVNTVLTRAAFEASAP